MDIVVQQGEKGLQTPSQPSHLKNLTLKCKRLNMFLNWLVGKIRAEWAGSLIFLLASKIVIQFFQIALKAMNHLANSGGLQ